MDLGQLFTQIHHLQINHLIQVNAPDGTATGFYVIDVSESRQKALQGITRQGER